MIDGTVILLQARADECWNPARSGRARRQRAWPSRQGVEGGSRCGCRRSHFRNRVSGTAGAFDKPGQEVQRHVSMRVSVLGDRFPGPGQQRCTALYGVDGRWTRDRPRCRRSTTGVTDAEVMRNYWPVTIGVTESRLTDMAESLGGGGGAAIAAAEWCRGRASERAEVVLNAL